MPKKIVSPLLQDLFQIMRDKGASDLHLKSFRYPAIRVNRELITLVNTQILEPEQVSQFLEELVGPEGVKQVFRGEEVDFAFSYEDVMRVRGNSFLNQGVISIALRSITEIRTLSELNLPEELEIFARAKQGFFLITGPTGQGKSTTLASLIDIINRERKEHILTIENPIEFVFESQNSYIDQREVGLDTKSFYDGLVSAFRQDVDVLMIGEMRDTETIEAAVTAGETGHLVFSTLHTNTASQTIDRIIDAFPATQQQQIRNQLASSLLGVFSQRLIKSTKGYLVPAYELLVANDAVENLIREGHVYEIDTVIETGRDSGMIDMNKTLVSLVRAGEITVEDALLHATNDRAVRDML
jgi:twitching motility protein PilT